MRIVLIISFWLGLAALSHAQSLATRLDSTRRLYVGKMSPEANQGYEASVAAIKTKLVPSAIKKVGDTFPNMVLTSAQGQPTTLSDMLKDGPMVLTYYRGGWCPYCNITLKAYQGYTQAFKAKGVQMLGVSYEEGPKLTQVVERNGLTYPLYADKGLIGAQALGIAYEAKPGMMLPLAATYLVDVDGRIAYAFTETDYRQRAEPEDLLKALALLKPNTQSNPQPSK
jgi:peroxiredoxin